MGFFRRKRRHIRGVVDAGSDSIKAILFERPPGGGAPQAALPRPLEKFVWDLPAAYSGERLVRKIREGVFHMVRRLEEVPEEILIAIGPHAAEYAARTWRVEPERGGGVLTRRDIRAEYHKLFAQNTDLRRAMIVAPVEVLVNGYPVAWKGPGPGEEVLPRKDAAEIAFRTLALYMPVSSGATFAEIKESLGGMPIEFIPLVIAEKYAVAGALGARDAFVVDVGGDETTLLAIRGGRFQHAAFVPYGVRRFTEALAKKAGCTYPEAREHIRRYGQEGGGRELRAYAEEAVEQAVPEWKGLFVRALDSFYPIGPLPAEVLLTGGGARFPELRRALQAPDWLGGFSHASAPALRVVEGAAFFGGDTLGGHLTGPEDAGLAALMVYSINRQPLF